MLTACYLLNRVPNKRNKTTTYEVWYKKQPNLSYIRVWGCRVVVRLHDPKRKTLGEKGIDCIFVGYAEHSKAYRDDLFDDVPSEILEPRKEKDPRTYDEAMQSRDAAFWKEAIDDEIGSIMENNTWVLSDLLPGCKPLGCKLIIKRKMKVDGTIDKFKAGLVIQGFRQKEGIDYFDTYAPVARITTIRLGEEDDEKICLGVDLEPDEWIKDSGCSKHMTGNRKLFSTYKAYNRGNVIFGSNLRGNIIGKGKKCDNNCRVTFSKHDSEITMDCKVIGRKPTLDYFRVFGSKCFILNTKDYLTKFEPKSYEESLNVTFNETLPPSKTSPLVDDDVDEEEAI
ncbi:zinc finger, CCHC-type containing protein [Tanacetum coccineum]|uniref:Zinc finger, CCHC-type containing protein n=1 Tax=Tanacetum coccineum TaxID=301880 RepID=A0ABQ5DF19_9ASTR